MLISNFNLYKTEWLDLVFDDRNKNYGAYELRRTYASTMVKAMSITFLTIALVCGGYLIAISGKEIVIRTPVDLTPDPPPVVIPIKEIKPPTAPKHVKALPVTPPVATTKFVTMEVKPDPIAVNPPKIADITGAVGQETTKGDPITSNFPVVKAPAAITDGGGGATDESVHPTRGLDVMPEPVGGSNAWAKFLSKNLRFPFEAQQDGISGRVMLSFIIEKDGRLSNIVVDNGAGHGFDEEALRVLKLAKAWKPGMQNGRVVRVKYSIPINFQLSE